MSESEDSKIKSEIDEIMKRVDSILKKVQTLDPVREDKSGRENDQK